MSVALILAGSAGALILLLFLRSRSHTRQLISKLPGPAINPIFGNVLQMPSTQHEFHKYLCDQVEQYRDQGIFKIEIGLFRNFCMIFKAEFVEKLLSSNLNQYLRKSVEYHPLIPWLSDGLLLSWGDKWKTRRRLLTPAFHFKILQDFLEVMNEQSEVFVNKLEEKVDGPAFDLMPMTSRCTLDIICQSAFGHHCGAQTEDNSEYVAAVLGIGRLAFTRWQTPWLSPDIIFNNLPIGKQFYRYLRTLHDFTNKVIRQRKADFLAQQVEKVEGEDSAPIGKKQRLAFLDLLLQSSLENHLTDDDIREEVDTFMFEGHDTTAVGLAWSMYLIGRHPDVQKKVHEELDEVFGASNRPVTEADFKKLKYLECVVKESLRVYPSVSFFGRGLEEDIKFGDHIVPKGTSLMVNTFQLHRDPRFFPDPEKFDPDRFSLENATGRHPYAYVPFSAGLRNCIGQKFAMNEERVVLASVLRSFNIESIHSPSEMMPTTELVLRPENGIWVKLTHRT